MKILRRFFLKKRKQETFSSFFRLLFFLFFFFLSLLFFLYLVYQRGPTTPERQWATKAMFGREGTLAAMEAGRASAVILALLPIQAALALAALVSLTALTWALEKRSWREAMNLSKPGEAALELAWGFLLGAALISATAGILQAKGWLSVEGVAWRDSSGSDWKEALCWSFMMFALVALGEEILFRGVLFRLLEEGLGSWLALLLSGFLFGFVHRGNPNSSPWAVMAITLEAGILLGALYMVTRRIWAVVGVHWAWNFFLGPVFGLPVSGNHFPSIISSRLVGPPLWTGGKFGPEAGLVCVTVCLLLSVVLLWIARKKGRFYRPDWMSWLLRSRPMGAHSFGDFHRTPRSHGLRQAREQRGTTATLDALHQMNEERRTRKIKHLYR
jgi:membrane protease YdiL (CAAX protease family)